MKDILKELYYVHVETTPPTLSKEQEEANENAHQAYTAFLSTLSREQKQLFHTYEDLRGILHTEEKEALYKSAFLSGFDFAKEIYTQKRT